VAWNARKVPKPKAQASQDDGGQDAGPYWHLMAGDEDFGADHQPEELSDSHEGKDCAGDA